MIGKDIPKITLPPELGEGPVYSPETRKSEPRGNKGGGNKKNFRRKPFRGKKGGKPA